MKFFKGILWGACRATLIERSQREACRKLRVEGLEEKEMLSVSSFSFESCSNSAYVENIQAAGSASLPNGSISLSNCDSEQTASSLMNEMMDSFGDAGEEVLLTRASSEIDASSGMIEEIDVDGYVDQENSQITESSGASTYSGGSSSGGSSSSPYVTYSGGGDYDEGKYIIPEGRWLTFNAFGVTQGVVITAGIAHGGTCVDDFNLISGSIIHVMGNTYDISTARDTLMTEEDEAFDVVFNIYVDGILTNTNTYSFLLVEKSEFISDADYGVEASYNSDNYRSCISSQAVSGNSLMFRPTAVDAVGTFGAIEAYGNSNIYSLTSARCGSVDVASYFSIDSSTGEITLSVEASEFLTATNGSYSCTLNILVENSKYRHLSGGSDYSDTAVIDLVFSHWDVNRDGEEVADALPSDGCSITELAQYVGLEPAEFAEWLTLNNPTAEVELFNRTTKLCSELVEGDVLLGSSISLFAVPNTIYAAWCWNPAEKASMKWEENISQIEALGFKVALFSNDSFTLAEDAKSVFWESINSYSDLKQLQGIYLTGHGDCYPINENDPSSPYEYCFGLHTGSIPLNWGPTWSVDYYSVESFQVDDPNSWAISQALDYKLGVFLGHSCYSHNASSSMLVSASSIKCGFSGSTVSDKVQSFASAWGYVANADGTYNIGGRQGTSIVQNVELFEYLWTTP